MQCRQTRGAAVPDWIAVDWGTSRLRVWAMAADCTVIDQCASEDGMGSLTQTQFEPALLRLIGDWIGPQGINIVACGMVGSRQGWAEAGYLAVPCAPIGGQMTRPPGIDQRLHIHIVPGLKQDRPADVMRGEETQIAGYLRANPGFDGVLCLPGTHTKWCHVSAGEVVSFRTFMTGELFALLGRHSVLRHSLTGDGLNDDAFKTAVNDTLSSPQALAARLFSLRAEGLLHGAGSAELRGQLSGTLIGAELAAARSYWLGQSVVLIGDPHLTRLYSLALANQAVDAQQFDAAKATITGLCAAYTNLRGSAQ